MLAHRSTAHSMLVAGRQPAEACSQVCSHSVDCASAEFEAAQSRATKYTHRLTPWQPQSIATPFDSTIVLMRLAIGVAGQGLLPAAAGVTASGPTALRLRRPIESVGP